MKKKVISALLASTMIVSLVACGSTGSGWFCSGIQRTPDDELLPRHPGRPRGGSPCRRRRPVAYPVADCSSVFQTGYRNHRPVYIRWLLERVFPGPGINEQRDELSVTDLHPSDLRSDSGRCNPDSRAVSAVSTELQQITGGSKGIYRPCSYADCISVPAEILRNRYYTGSSKRIMKYTKRGFLKRNRKPLFCAFLRWKTGVVSAGFSCVRGENSVR